MIKSKNSRNKWLPLLLVPMFSVTVLAGCSSDDDDDTPGEEITDPSDPGMDTDPVVVVTDPDADGDGVPDAFQSDDSAEDADGNSIADIYQTAADGTTTDTNGNDIDDSYEAELTLGEDANGDGIDDAAAATLAGGSTDPDPADPDPDGSGTPVVDPVDQTGPINNNQLPIGNAGVAMLDWTGSTLEGQIDIAEGVMPAGAGIYTGIQASGNGQQLIAFNGNGNPSYFLPRPLSATQQAAVAENIVAGNLYVQVDLANGGSENGIILLPGVEPKFTDLAGANAVPEQDVFTSGAGYVNINTATGDFTAVVRVDLNASDLDADGAPETVSAVHIHAGAVGEEGPVIVGLADTGNGRLWGVKATFSAEDLETILSGGAYFNVHRTDSSNFIRGQIP